MSREIKFRAWKASESRMISWDELSHDYRRRIPDILDRVYMKDVMQFTGLHDKNGKEIYEGDIYNAGGNINYQVFYKSGAVCGGISYESSIPLGWEADEYEPDTMIEGEMDFMEIIGNIYEHPELLEGQAE